MRSSDEVDVGTPAMSLRVRRSNGSEATTTRLKLSHALLLLVSISVIVSFNTMSIQQSNVTLNDDIQQTPSDFRWDPINTPTTTAVLPKEEEQQQPQHQYTKMTVDVPTDTAPIESSHDTIAMLPRTNHPTKLCPTFQTMAGDSRYLQPTLTFDDILPHGFVMQDLAQRVLSRDIAQSHVLLMGSNTSSVITNMYQKARQEHHEVHWMDTTNQKSTKSSTSTLDQWWNALVHRPNWLLLTVLDHDHDHDNIFSSPQAASTFFTKGPTMTYIVMSVTASLRSNSQHHHGTTTTDNDDNDNDDSSQNYYTFHGMESVTHLLNHHYKVQLLSASDFWNYENLRETQGPGVFLPNSLITKDNLESFFIWGAQAAATSRACVVAQEEDIKTTSMRPPPIFKAFLFATQGLDLAIPSRREYLNASMHPKVPWFFPYNDKPHALRQMADSVTLKPCPQQHRLQIKFLPKGKDDEVVDKELNTWDVLEIKCDGHIVTDKVRARYDLATVWISPNAESACVKLNCSKFSPGPVVQTNDTNDALDKGMQNQQVSCTTRIIPTKKDHPTTADTLGKPNILVVMIDPISRAQFDFSMPKTKAFLQSQARAIRFSRFSTVGNNSGPNQAALYSGDEWTSHHGISDAGTWIWDRLKDAGYATFKAEDGCIANSNMVQSMMPDTTHGQALHELFCFHFARPNCVGNFLAANYLFNHMRQFIDAYTRTASVKEEQRPWAAFLSLIDTHEDTMTLGRLIDDPLTKFLRWFSTSPTRSNNTLLVLLSDHGLHYGPYFQSNAGRRERSEPILYIRLPNSTRNSEYHVNLRRNADKYVTPFDVHESILQIAGVATRKETPIGTSLFSRLPPSRLGCQHVPAIPASHCELIKSLSNSALHTPDKIPLPPSLLSFYADIPRDHRWKIEPCTPTFHNIKQVFKSIRNEGKSCNCSTSHRDWYPCRVYPWNKNISFPRESFLVVDCPQFPLFFDVRVARNEELVSQLKNTKVQDDADITRRTNDIQKKPNILVIEVDSVSAAHAHRHMPLTLKLLDQHRIQNSNGQCLGDLCAVDFPKFAVVGPNSVANQVASLSGCITTLRHPTCFNGTFEIGDVCTDPTVMEFELELRSRGPKHHRVYCPANTTSPFLYDIAKENGYVTFFGEEFCYPGSPWVVQDRVFPLNADIMLHQVFCRLLRRRLPRKQDLYVNILPGLCVDNTNGMPLHEIGLDLIRGMWDAYREVPKFAFLNSMVAHNYAADTAKVPLLLEEYDVALSKMIQSFLEHEEAHNTIIVLRSDHGLQGGDAVTVDYSTQIEQRHPWTEVIVPRHYPIENLLANSDKVVTPHDLYTMIKELMTGRSEAARPKWRYNLLYDAIPADLSCDERKIPSDFCPSFDAPRPTFGVCNAFESRQSVFCRDPWLGAKVLLNQTFTSSDASALASDEGQQSGAKDNPCEVELSDQAVLAYNKTVQFWKELDVLVEKNRTSAKVSGGMFLYPRQSLIFLSILRQLESELVHETDTIRVCETGFGAGHSAALFLQSSDRVELITFDRFDRPYQDPAVQALGAHFGWSRLSFVVGDACKTVPEYFSNPNERRCDVIHGSSFCPSDMKNLIQNLRPNGIVTATAMDSLHDNSVYFGEKAQWRHLRQEGCLSGIQCWKEKNSTLEKNFVFAKKGSILEHEFCVAVNTGECSSRGDAVGQVARDIDFGRLCTTSSRVPAPL